MDAKEARDYLYTLKKILGDTGRDDWKPYIDALDVALDAVEPPMGAGKCRWVYTPDDDLLPYEDIKRVTNLENDIEGCLEAAVDSDENYNPNDSYCDLTATLDELHAARTALSIYKGILLRVNADEIKRRLHERKQREDAIDAACEWHPATELPEVNHWYKIRGTEAIACGYALLAATNWNSTDWILNGMYHIDTKDNVVTEWRYLTKEEEEQNDA